MKGILRRLLIALSFPLAAAVIVISLPLMLPYWVATGRDPLDDAEYWLDRWFEPLYGRRK